MPTRKRVIAAGVVTFIAALVILFPARVAYDWFAPAGTAVSGITGSIWSGQAENANVSGFYLADLEWRFRPLRLFTGKLTYAITASPASGFVETDLGLGFGGDLYLQDLNAAMALASVSTLTGVRGLTGNATARFEQLRLSAGLPVVANGRVEVANLVLPQVAPGSIGGYRADFFTQENGIGASIEDTDGVLDLAASLTLNSDRSYQLLGQVAAKPETPQQIRQQLRFLGSPNERGQHQLRLEGAL